MSDLKIITTKNAAQPVAAYSQAVQANGMIFVSGQVPLDPSGKLIEGSITEKTRACITSLKAILEEAGSGIERVVKTTIFITSMENFKEVNAEYGVHFTHKPARSCVAVKELPLGVPVEIEVIALAGRG